MNIQDEAVKVVDDVLARDPQVYREMFGDEPNEIVRVLADAGLLAPELPDHIEASTDNMPNIYINGGHVYAVLNNGYDSDWECLDPSEATEFALRLLAAAKHAEEETVV